MPLIFYTTWMCISAAQGASAHTGVLYGRPHVNRHRTLTRSYLHRWSEASERADKCIFKSAEVSIFRAVRAFPTQRPWHRVLMAPFFFVEGAAIITTCQIFIYETKRFLWVSMKMADYIQKLALKGIFHTKMKMLTSFTHHHIISNPYVLFFSGTQKMSWKMFVLFFPTQ